MHWPNPYWYTRDVRNFFLRTLKGIKTYFASFRVCKLIPVVKFNFNPLHLQISWLSWKYQSKRIWEIVSQSPLRIWEMVSQSPKHCYRDWITISQNCLGYWLTISQIHYGDWPTISHIHYRDWLTNFSDPFTLIFFV